jgi:ABC-type multidrug transport system fused ATPase/permease subunit
MSTHLDRHYLLMFSSAVSHAPVNLLFSTEGLSGCAFLQVAWIQNKSIKENILFGQDYSEAMYQRVLHVCALEQDLEMLPQGDESMGGLRGMNLSGGQRQRVNIARAAYFDADTVLLDNALR